MATATFAKAEGEGQAHYEILPEEAQVVRQIFHWIGQERATLGEVRRRLHRAGVRTPSGKTTWDRTTLWSILKNPAYKGTAAFGKTKSGPLTPKLRPQRGSPSHPKRPVSSIDVPSSDWIYIPVPALVEEALFEAVQEQLEENRQRARQRQRGVSYLLQGLTVCAHCGYTYYGKPTTYRCADGTVGRYAYYRCVGTDAYRFGGEKVCDNVPIRTDKLELQVWNEMRSLLEHPQRLAQEYERRLQIPGPEHETRTALQAQLTKIRQSLARLIDSYTDGLIEKYEFEPRLHRLRQRQAQLESQAQQLADEEAQQAEIQSIIMRLEEFTAKVKDNLDSADWFTKRDLIRMLVKRVEIGKEAVNIVFRVTPPPFELAPTGGFSQHCWDGKNAVFSKEIVDTLSFSQLLLDCLYRRQMSLDLSFLLVALAHGIPLSGSGPVIGSSTLLESSHFHQILYSLGLWPPQGKASFTHTHVSGAR